jgi:Fe-S cluster assembly scaffold protein SufB
MQRHLITANDRELIISGSEEFLLWDYLDSSQAAQDLVIKIGPGCSGQYILVVGDGPVDFSQFSRKIYLSAGSKLASYQAYFGQSDFSGELNYYLDQSVKLTSQALLYQVASQQLTIKDNYIFQGPASTGQFLVQGLLDDQAKSSYYSDIVIEPLAQGTDSRIDMKLYLLSRQASGQLLPGLKIAANEVKAGHGASTFNLSPEDLFYLESRGLAADQVKALVINSSAQHFLADISDQDIKTIITQLIEERRVRAQS